MPACGNVSAAGWRVPDCGLIGISRPFFIHGLLLGQEI